MQGSESAALSSKVKVRLTASILLAVPAHQHDARPRRADEQHVDVERERVAEAGQRHVDVGDRSRQPETLIVDGYGVAGPEVKPASAPAVIVIGAGFENVSAPASAGAAKQTPVTATAAMSNQTDLYIQSSFITKHTRHRSRRKEVALPKTQMLQARTTRLATAGTVILVDQTGNRNRPLGLSHRHRKPAPQPSGQWVMSASVGAVLDVSAPFGTLERCARWCESQHSSSCGCAPSRSPGGSAQPHARA